MLDKVLARRVLNKIWKEVMEAFKISIEPEVVRQLQRALNDLDFMSDILHLDDIEVIDISKQPTLNKGGKEEWELHRS